LKRISSAGTVREKLQWMERPEPQQTRTIEPRIRIGPEWLSVSAADRDNDRVERHRPGVCFLGNDEWTEPQMHEGKIARFGGNYPGLGGPNFLINDPPADELELRLSYWTESGGTVRVYDGRRYQTVGRLEANRRWMRLTCRVPKSLVTAATAADRPDPGLNVLCELSSPGVWVATIAVRTAPAAAIEQESRQ